MKEVAVEEAEVEIIYAQVKDNLAELETANKMEFLKNCVVRALVQEACELPVGGMVNKEGHKRPYEHPQLRFYHRIPNFPCGFATIHGNNCMPWKPHPILRLQRHTGFVKGQTKQFFLLLYGIVFSLVRFLEEHGGAYEICIQLLKLESKQFTSSIHNMG